MSVEDYDNAILMYSKAIKQEANAYLYVQLSRAFLGKRDIDNAIYASKLGSEIYGLSGDSVDCYLEATRTKKVRPKRFRYFRIRCRP